MNGIFSFSKVLSKGGGTCVCHTAKVAGLKTTPHFKRFNKLVIVTWSSTMFLISDMGIRFCSMVSR